MKPGSSFKNIVNRIIFERADVLPKSPMGQAISYALGNWKAFNRYLEDGDLAIDNNRAERALRGPVVGRGNWTFLEVPRRGREACGNLAQPCIDLQGPQDRSLSLPPRPL